MSASSFAAVSAVSRWPLLLLIAFALALPVSAHVPPNPYAAIDATRDLAATPAIDDGSTDFEPVKLYDAPTSFAIFTSAENRASGTCCGSSDDRALQHLMHARFYSPGIARFLSVDPTWSSADLSRPQSWNRYSYVENNPINRVDPDGKVSIVAVFGALDKIADIAGLAYDLNQIRKHGLNKSTGGALAFDVLLTVVPIPGNVGTLKLLDDVAGGAKTASNAIEGGRRLLPFKDADRVKEVNNTLDRMKDGVQKYKQDRSVFKNAEGKLPGKPSGYYKEYTVDTPRATNRGTRRVVQGKSGETYYTDDHYNSFVKIDPTLHK